MALSAIEVRALQALRAPGGMTAEQAWERWPTTGTKALHELVRKGFAADVDERFLITKSGRAACPPVNPLLAAVPAKPKETAMLMNCHSYKDVVAAIADAGPSGLTRKQLADRFAADSRADLTRIDAHVFYALTKVAPPPIAKIKPGHYVAAEFAPDPETVETKLQAAIKRITTQATAAPGIPEEEVEKHARDYAEMIDFDLEAAQGVDLTAVDGVYKAWPRDAEPETAAARPQSVAEKLPSFVPFCEDIELNDPDQVEFAIFSSGGLDMYTDQGNVTLGRDVLRKLRAFLGLFAEAA